MACNSLFYFNSSSSIKHLGSNHSTRIIRKLFLPSTPIKFSSPSTHRRRRWRRLIISEMESSKTDSTPQFHDEDTKSINSGDQNSLAPTSIASGSGQNLQLICLANMPKWAKLVLGSIVFLAIPFCRKALRVKDVTKTMEEVAEVVEMVAEVTEKAAEGIAEALPDGSSLKEAAIRLEKIAFFVDKQAEITESFITKVDDAVGVLDATLKPLIDGGLKMKADEEVVMSPTKIVLTATPKLKEDL
ncbi:hypothetical protein MA16_Dca015534 [Dendrobium catenatum]|uniref:Uncharacterized protein n=1 Tax=Dendrobium catenatum TaxID=906689 RepID=A0A2I0WHP8_9ASPA|nr:hypothetical protein MA16_Dca015534 [Dendrobium catenatum]